MSNIDGTADVLIAGGGPVGMGLAIELGQRGISTIVVERYRTPQPIPKGQNLTQRTMEHFHFWEIEGALRAARPVPTGAGIGGLTKYGTLLSPHSHDWLQRELVRDFYFTANERLPQYLTEQVLRSRAETLESVDIRYGWTCTGLDQTGDHVDITIRDSNGSDETMLRGRYLVGCDGSRSTVRQAAGITQALSDHEKLMVLIVFRSDAFEKLVARYPGKSFFNIIHPDLDGYWLFFGRVGSKQDWFFHAPVPADARDGDFDFAAYLHRAVGAEFALTIDHVGFWDMRVAIADDYRADRVFVAGDAAHSHPPYGGYGINMGFEDARNLGWKLDGVLRGWAGPDLLDSYGQERRGVFTSVAHDFIEHSIERDRQFLERYDPDADPERFHTAWSARAEAAAREVATFRPNYRGSAIVRGEASGLCDAHGEHVYTAEAGQHLAPVTLSSGDDVYDLLGGGFALLTFGAEPREEAAFERAADTLGIPLVVITDSWAAPRTRYGSRLILVRPDQFVAWAGDMIDAAEALAILRTAVGYAPADSETTATDMAGETPMAV